MKPILLPESTVLPFKKIYFIWILLIIGSRLIPHVPNFSLVDASCFFAGVYLSRFAASILILIALVLSDSLLAYFYGYPAFGSWTLFSYSGFLAITLLGTAYNDQKLSKLSLFVLPFASLIYWLWTNLGTWLTTQLYDHSYRGLLACYTSALPFLHNQLLANVMVILMVYIYQMRLKMKKYAINLQKNPYLSFP